MFLVTRLADEFKSYYSHNRPFLKFAGYAGAVGFPLFYVLQQLKSTHPYDSAVMRAAGALTFLAMGLRDHWPQSLRKYYLLWSYFTVLYGLPFFFIFQSLKNGGGVVSVANTFMAVIFLILLTDWRNTVAGTDPRERTEDEDGRTADVRQCRTFTNGAWSSDLCPRDGGLDQNIYGDLTP